MWYTYSYICRRKGEACAAQPRRHQRKRDTGEAYEKEFTEKKIHVPAGAGALRLPAVRPGDLGGDSDGPAGSAGDCRRRLGSRRFGGWRTDSG